MADWDVAVLIAAATKAQGSVIIGGGGINEFEFYSKTNSVLAPHYRGSTFAIQTRQSTGQQL
jgi:hypothetical protein